MKEVPKKHLPEISGGDYQDGGCIPMPDARLPDDPPNPFTPKRDFPTLDYNQGQS